MFEKEKTDQSIYQDFLKELEMLSARIFVLEKHLINNRTGNSENAMMAGSTLFTDRGDEDNGGNDKTPPNKRSPLTQFSATKAGTSNMKGAIEKLVDKVNLHIDHIHQLAKTENDIPHIREVVKTLQSMFTREAALSKILEEIQGFIEFFNDQWNKFNMSILEHNAGISKLERERLTGALERLRTPRDAAYELEISRLQNKCERLENEYNGTRLLLSELEDLLRKNEGKIPKDLAGLIRTEIMQLHQLRQVSEEAVSRHHSDSMMYVPI